MRADKTYAEVLIKQGYEKGLAKLEQEKRRAVLHSQREVLTELLEQRFGPLPAQYSRYIRDAKAEKLKRWTLRVLATDSLASVFEDA